MNAETSLPRRFSLESPVFKAALLALCAIAPIKVMADTQPASAPESLTARVPLADVDLSAPEGQRIAYERLRQTARRLCSRLEAMHPQSLAHHPTYIACVDEALARALQQVNGPALAVTQKSLR
jgi:UrcA family protein